jgi:thiopeptide-type bacteriocin biosynthesis protein
MAAERLDWLSAHLPVAGSLHGDAADALVLGVVAPVAGACRRRGWTRRGFFLRYSVGGNHLRFRLQGEPRVLAEAVRPELVSHAAAAGLPEVQWVPYEPELERYGGAAGVEVAEDLFDASSRTALALLERLPAGDRRARLGHALAAMVAGLEAFVGDRAAAAELAGDYGSTYLRQSVPREARHRALAAAFERGVERQDAALAGRVDALWHAATAGALPPPLDTYQRDLVRVRGRLERLIAAGRLLSRRGTAERDRDAAVRQLLPSYLHMTTNRLGVTVIEECYLSRVVSVVLTPHRRTA